MVTIADLESRILAIRTVAELPPAPIPVLTGDFNLSAGDTNSIIRDFGTWLGANGAPIDLVMQLLSYTMLFPQEKFGYTVKSSVWNNRVEALRVLGKICEVWTPISPWNPVWRLYYTGQNPRMSPSLDVVGLTYRDGFWDEFNANKDTVNMSVVGEGGVITGTSGNPKWIGSCEWWFKVDRLGANKWVDVILEGIHQADVYVFPKESIATGWHFLFLKSGDSIKLKPDNQRLSLLDRTDVEIVKHVVKPFTTGTRNIYYDFDLTINEDVRWFVALVDDNSVDWRANARLSLLDVREVP